VTQRLFAGLTDAGRFYDFVTMTDVTGFGTVTATAGNVLIADGSQWVSVALTGDVRVNSSGRTRVDFISTMKFGSVE
jgi:hypothetical protein